MLKIGIMTQKEFEERTKLSISQAEYAKIDALYLACGDDIDKDVFCKMYMDFDGRLELMHRIERQLHGAKNGWNAAIGRMKQIEDENLTKREEIAEFMLRKATEHRDSEFYNGAIALIGLRSVVLTKIRLKLPLCETDMDYINKNLK